ncbi:MAG: PTS lactose/cellobiose transporter subunit IIA [Atopobiaceae bacterium]|jgi:PTS system lactose-specific IIA component|nr:PTS lactose/cellobiose transporter subunit IIA [Atopobiaceae bacterium]MCI2174194.1 PTS lactose/cellobiose transporter subunit IIA [Atopobiaceae bacterium]MCI2206835.1 PTS lactose/cellobiose transporter subunit IIA [Atopobiaceae bacterium]
MTTEEIQKIGFEIVAYSGDARSSLLEGIKKAKAGDLDGAQRLKDDAQECINDAHKSQTALLSQEAGGETSQIGMIMIHAQDHLMTTMMLMDIFDTLVDVYR